MYEYVTDICYVIFAFLIDFHISLEVIILILTGF